MLPVTVSGEVTASVAEPLIEFMVAVIVAVPAPTPVARPAPLMVATAGADELQLTDPVTFCVLLSL
jgi:hypothetical protein